MEDHSRSNVSSPDALAQAMLHFEQGEVRAAQAILAQLVSQNQSATLDTVPVEQRVRTLLQYALVLALSGQHEDAQNAIDAAQAIASATHGVESPLLVEMWNAAGVNHKLAGHFTASAVAYEQAMALLDRLGIPMPAYLLHNLAGLACALGDYACAEQLSQQAIYALQTEQIASSLDLAADLVGLADALSGLHRPMEAESHYQRALRMYESTGNRDHPEVASLLHNLADTLTDLGRLDEAIALYEESIRRKQAAFGRLHPEIAASLHNVAQVRWMQGRAKESLDAIAQAVALCDGLPHDHFVRAACVQLADVLLRKNATEQPMEPQSS